ncbi:hypothetical protein E3N88_29357 [Mikania micrantha]|uniref:Reverse transcriptase domain-containing protein n=1 Tax=Mikania micrantha TaxID=192012 RepID=A0A5N6MLG7_9ASTR|nr:hypothetical protein E3N88_29357 [Mikania micrantha]
MLKVSPWKGIVRFGKQGKLASRIQVEDKLQFVEEPVEVMDREVKKLKRSPILIMKIRRNSKCGPEFTWERLEIIIIGKSSKNREHRRKPCVKRSSYAPGIAKTKSSLTKAVEVRQEILCHLWR